MNSVVMFLVTSASLFAAVVATLAILVRLEETLPSDTADSSGRSRSFRSRRERA